MRTMDTPHTDEQKLTTEDEIATVPCPECERPVERLIPAGSPVGTAEITRTIVLTCTECNARLEAEEQAKRDAQLRRDREDRSELPVMLRGLTWDSYDVSRPGAEKALAAAREWAEGKHERRGLMFVGAVGVGKTRLAATATWAALDRISVRYVNVAELIVKMSAGFGDRDRQMALKALTGKGALVLDDIDKVNPSMHVLSNLYTAIDGRVQSGAPLIVTTNMRPSQLVEKFAVAGRNEDSAERKVAAEAIVSRLRGHCSLHLIEGKDGRES